MKYLNIIQIVVSILLIISILLQGRGAGVSGVFGGESAVYQTKRGLEKFLFILTIILSFIFLGTVLLSVFIQ
jgi:protein translocase SecG subunit